MDFKTSVKSVFHKYATFSGRASRSEYWYFTLLNILVSWGAILAGIAIGSIIGSTNSGSEGLALGAGAGYMIGLIIASIYGLAVLIPGLAVTVRRLHDTGRGGGWIFIYLVPIVGPIVLLVFLVTGSEEETNRFGEKPE